MRMNKNPDHQLDDLFRAARAERRDTSRAEFAFETRLLARIREERDQAGWLGMFAWAWKLCPAFASIVLALAIWLAVSGARSADDLREAAGATTSDALTLA